MKAIFTLFLLFLSLASKAQAPVSDERINRILEEKFQLNKWIGNPAWEASEPSHRPGEWRNAINEIKLTNQNSSSVEEAEVFIAMDPNNADKLVVSFMEFQANSLAMPVYYSGNGGTTWTKSTFSTQAVANSDFPGFIIGGGGDPVFAYAADGTLYFSWLYLMVNTQTFELYMSLYWAESNDGGATFTVSSGTKKRIGYGDLTLTGNTGTDGDGVFDRQWLAVDNSGGANDGRLYCSFLFIPNDSTNKLGNGTTVTYKDAGVDSFTQVHFPVSVTPDAQFSNIAVDNQGDVHVTYGDYNSNNVMHALWPVDSPGFMMPTIISSASVIFPNNPLIHERENAAINMALDYANDKIYVVWTDFVNGKAIGYFAYSSDDGDTWSTPLDIRTLGADLSDQGMYPTLAVSPSGKISITFYGLDATNVSQEYVTESKDGGLTFNLPKQISTVYTDFKQYDANNFFGDYNTSLRTEGKTYSAWIDGRNNAGPKLYIAISDTGSYVGITQLSPLTDVVSLGEVYPNPSNKVAMINVKTQTASEYAITCYSTDGRAMNEPWRGAVSSGSSALTMNIPEGWPAGNYLIMVELTESTFVRQMVLQ